MSNMTANLKFIYNKLVIQTKNILHVVGDRLKDWT